jgi:mitochondrial fission protein ELM1
MIAPAWPQLASGSRTVQLDETCWVITPGEPGMRSQALGLAAAVGLPIIEKQIAVGAPWKWLPAGLLPMPRSAFHAAETPLEPPWPRLVIACGRRSIPPALAIKRLSAGRTVAAYVQNPELAGKKFDLVVALPHDEVSGENVVTVRTALHGVTAAKLEGARAEWRARFAPAGTPLLGVLVGGDSSGYRLTEATTTGLVQLLRRAHAGLRFNVALTPSRRTGASAKRALSVSLGSEPWAFIWDEQEPNPYLAILALSDRLIVTGESISMISEALATGCPVHVLPLAGQGRRHDAFLTRLVDEGLVSLIADGDLDWRFKGPGPVNSTEEPVQRIRELLRRAPQV